LKELINNMRNFTISRVDNGSMYNSLSAIGISSKNYLDKGKLTVDETKLRAALQADPVAVKNLFSQSPANATEGQKGIITRLYDGFQTAFTKLRDKVGLAGSAQADESAIGKLLTQSNSNILTEQQRISTKEKKYYAQFTAMEKALNQYNSQSSWLTQQMSSGSGGN
jgi:flagellar hook-associated protein 2